MLSPVMVERGVYFAPII